MKLYAYFLLATYDVQPHKTRLNIFYYGLSIGQNDALSLIYVTIQGFFVFILVN
jgi:hypothetical protein